MQTWCRQVCNCSIWHDMCNWHPTDILALKLSKVWYILPLYQQRDYFFIWCKCVYVRIYAADCTGPQLGKNEFTLYWLLFSHTRAGLSVWGMLIDPAMIWTNTPSTAKHPWWLKRDYLNLYPFTSIKWVTWYCWLCVTKVEKEVNWMLKQIKEIHIHETISISSWSTCT